MSPTFSTGPGDMHFTKDFPRFFKLPQVVVETAMLHQYGSHGFIELVKVSAREARSSVVGSVHFERY